MRPLNFLNQYIYLAISGIAKRGGHYCGFLYMEFTLVSTLHSRTEAHQNKACIELVVSCDCQDEIFST